MQYGYDWYAEQQKKKNQQFIAEIVENGVPGYQIPITSYSIRHAAELAARQYCGQAVFVREQYNIQNCNSYIAVRNQGRNNVRYYTIEY